MKIARPPSRQPIENTISLINVVFLMLIFFLVAGQLTPPVDPEVTLSESEGADPLPPPDALFAHKDGRLLYRGSVTDVGEFLQDLRRRDHAGGGELIVRLAADLDLPAQVLVGHVDALYATGASKVLIVTRRSRK